MVAYHHFVELSQSGNSEERGQAAHLAALAFLAHTGPADEQAALYAALIGFLDDPSVKVRAALAYGLLHTTDAPRPILLALLQDSRVIARAVAQYSPALIDADLRALIPTADLTMLLAVAERERMSLRVAAALIARDEQGVTLRVLARGDFSPTAEMLGALAEAKAENAKIRGALLARKDLPAAARLLLVEAVTKALREIRIVKGAIAPRRLERLLRNSTDDAMTLIGEREAARVDAGYAAQLVQSSRINTRVMLHAIVNGHVLFFADCVAELSEMPREKVFTLLEHGSRSALNALLVRCGLVEGVRNLICRLIFHARTADLADDVASRHFVVTALTEELIVEHDGVIPPELEEAFSYLSEQNVALARQAARGVMSAFGGERLGHMPVPAIEPEERLALPAA
jgi:uncharacterized protein (DUF2336 family)